MYTNTHTYTHTHTKLCYRVTQCTKMRFLLIVIWFTVIYSNLDFIISLLRFYKGCVEPFKL